MSSSAEPHRKAPYSSDLRWRIVWQRLAHELTFRAISHNLNVAVSTIHRTWELFQRTGDVEPSPTPHQPDALELFVVGLVLERPEMYLHEICQDILDHTGTEVSEATICRVKEAWLHSQKDQGGSCSAFYSTERTVYGPSTSVQERSLCLG